MNNNKMADDQWQEIVIQTGIDTLLKYLSEHDKSPVSEISTNIGVSEKRVKDWAKTLEKQGMLEINYSITDGMVLKYTDDNMDEIKNKIEMLDEQIEDNSTKLKKAVKQRNERLKEVKKELQTVVNQVDTLKKEESRIESQIMQIEDLEQTIEQEIDHEDQMNKKELHTIREINQVIEDIPTKTLEKIEMQPDSMETNIKAKDKLQMILDQIDEPVDVS